MASTGPDTGIGDWDFNERTKQWDQFEQRLSGARQMGTALAVQHNPAVHIQALTDLPPGGFIVPQAVMMALGGIDGPRPPEIDAIVAQTQAQVDAMQQQAAVLVQAAQAQGGDQSAFIQQMEAAKAASKQQMDQTLNTAYAQLENVGQQHPEAQNAIVEAVGQLSALVGSAEAAVSNTFDSAISIAQSILNAFESAVEAALSGVESVAESIGDGIASIFSGW